VPSKYFSLWANERHIVITELTNPLRSTQKMAAFRPRSPPRPMPAWTTASFVRFAPFVTPSYTSENTGMGGFVPPKVGYQADMYVYAAADGRLIAQSDYHHKTDAPFKADSVPYIKAGVRAVVAALDPAYALDGDSGTVPCAERPGRSAQGCGERADTRHY
jgi:hypothetical protein